MGIRHHVCDVLFIGLNKTAAVQTVKKLIPGLPFQEIQILRNNKVSTNNKLKINKQKGISPITKHNRLTPIVLSDNLKVAIINHF